MKFGPVPIEESLGAIAAHGVAAEGAVVKKGEAVTERHIAALRAVGIDRIVVARLQPGDIGENEAARRLAEAVVGGDGLRIEKAFTGRANIFASAAGVLLVDAVRVDRVNAIDESLTLATLPAYRMVEPGEMVATVKIIPFAVPGSALQAVIDAVDRPPLGLAPFRPLRIGVISTLLPGLKRSVVEKTLRVLAERLRPAAASIVADRQVPHRPEVLAEALQQVEPLCDIIVVYGASAIADRRDVIPAGIELAGGEVRHFGMPVDPGNLLLLARIGAKPVLGAPGCARSPKENGFDWVLQRLLAGLDVAPADIRGLGAGGLLMEIVSRPQPRLGEAAEAGAADSAFETTTTAEPVA